MYRQQVAFRAHHVAHRRLGHQLLGLQQLDHGPARARLFLHGVGHQPQGVGQRHVQRRDLLLHLQQLGVVLCVALGLHFGLVLRRDVLERAFDPHDPARFIAHGMAAGAHPQPLSMRQRHLGHLIQDAPGLYAVSKGLLHPFVKGGLEGFQHVVQGVRGRAVVAGGLFCAAHAKGAGNAGRQRECPAGQFHHPATQARHAARGLQHVVLRLQRGTHLFALLQRHGQLQFLPAQFQLVHGLAGQHLQRLQFLRRQAPAARVHHRQGAQGMAFVRDEGDAGVKADVGLTHHRRVGGKNGVPGRVFHHGGLVRVAQGVVAKRHGARRFAHGHAHGGLEPLPLGIQKIHHCHGRAAQPRRQHGQLVERIFVLSVQDCVLRQRPQPGGIGGVHGR